LQHHARYNFKYLKYKDVLFGTRDAKWFKRFVIFT